MLQRKLHGYRFRPGLRSRAIANFMRSLGGGLVLNAYVDGLVIESWALEDCFMKRWARPAA
jgi:hypothetical protein